MRVVVLVRHAKAEPVGGPTPDHARPLALRGRSDASTLGTDLASSGFEPDVAYVSDALRTAQTWELAAAGWDVPDVRQLPELYHATVQTVVELLRGTEPGADRVMVVGHEPTMSSTVAFLAGSGSDRAAFQRIAHGLPTGMAAVLEFDGEWADLGSDVARLRAVLGRGE